MNIPLNKKMSYGHYFMYPTNSTSTSSSSRQYPPSWHQTWANNQYLNNNYYLQYQNQYRYRWPANYAAYNYSPYNVYDYSSNTNNNYNENYYPKIKNPKSTVSINTKSSSIRPIKKVKYERRIETPSKKLEKSSQKKPSNSSSKKHSGYLVRHDSSKTNKKIDEQKNKENIKMQLISQLTNQTQIELNKLIEMKNKRRQITYLGIVTANPSDYVKKYGKDLIELPKTQELMHDTAAFNIEPVLI